jgi:citrate-Mg2+:H+ or citrate-Ca2+:H+ symporter, CitMHS family
MFQTTTSGKEELAKAVLMMASIPLAAGVFTGTMQGSGMLKAMAQTAVRLIAMPLGLLFNLDSFYFGVPPVVAQTAWRATGAMRPGGTAGQMTTGFPVSPLTPATFVIVGLTGSDLGDHQNLRFPSCWKHPR